MSAGDPSDMKAPVTRAEQQGTGVGVRPLALVTGGQRGIGAATALALARQGCDVAIADVRGADPSDILVRVEATGARGRAFEFDLADATDHVRLIDAVVQWGGPLGVLVNNAGIGAPSRGDLLDVSPAAFDRVLGVNLRGTFFLTQAAARHMLRTPCTHARAIVTVSSVSAELASIERGEYCVSKSGLAMVTRLFALRLAQAGIGVFEVRPGIIRTPMTQAVSATYDERIADGLVPMARWGEAEDVADAVAALASGRLAFATGSVLHVDGALSLPRL